jgi:acetoin utilization protein AcuB
MCPAATASSGGGGNETSACDAAHLAQPPRSGPLSTPSAAQKAIAASIRAARGDAKAALPGRGRKVRGSDDSSDTEEPWSLRSRQPVLPSNLDVLTPPARRCFRWQALCFSAGMPERDRSEITVERFMTHCPHTIGENQPLSVAHEMMRRYQIRHLPVLRGGNLVGILSLRDLHFIETLSDVDPEKVPVGDAMSTDTYTVVPGAALRRVAAKMADHRYGSAVIMDRERVIGIFTTVDGMRALSLVLAGTTETGNRERR